MDDTVMKEWICQEIPALTVNRKVVSTMLRKKKELVRCKDCKHGRIYYGDHVACDIIEHPSHDLDWFCADGERK